MAKLINANSLYAKLETMAREQWDHRLRINRIWCCKIGFLQRL